MVCRAYMMKSLLVAAIVAIALTGYGSAVQKLPYCCHKVDQREISEPILSFMVQKKNPPCVQAIIFQTEKGIFCSKWNAPWVRPKIVEFMAQQRSSSTLSLLKAITSSPSPPPTPTPTSTLSLLKAITSSPSPPPTPTPTSPAASSSSASESPTGTSSAQHTNQSNFIPFSTAQ